MWVYVQNSFGRTFINGFFSLNLQCSYLCIQYSHTFTAALPDAKQ